MTDNGIPTIRIRIGDEDLVLDPKRLSAGDTRLVRTATGKPFAWWLNQFGDDTADIDVIAVLIWIARRHAGERSPDGTGPLDLETVEASLSWGTMDRVEITFGDEDSGTEEDAEDPTGTSDEESS